MRTTLIACLPLAVLAACSDTDGADQPAQAEASAEVADIEAKPASDPAPAPSGVESHTMAAPFGSVRVDYFTGDEDSHPEPGRLAVTYFDAAGNQTANYPQAVLAGSVGQMSEWSVSDDFGPNPVIRAEGGFTGQGISCSTLTLTELAPGGPRLLVTIPMYYSDAGVIPDDTERTETEGTLGAPGPDGSFAVTYRGTISLTANYRREGNAYVLAKPLGHPIPEC